MTPLGDALRWQAEACRQLGSPMYERLCVEAAEDADGGGPVAAVAAKHAHLDRAGLIEAAVPLRLLGAVHRLVLEDRAPGLARHYPTAGGDLDPLAAWPAFRDLLEAEPAAVTAGMQRAPQTNEVGRASLLLVGLAASLQHHGAPIRLVEIGASGGLNLRADHFRLRLPDGEVGPPDSPVLLAPEWREPDEPRTPQRRRHGPPVGAPVEVHERLGCDVDPIDPTTAEGAVTLRAYVWPDQASRHRALDGAIEVARRVAAAVEPVDAVSFLQRLEPASDIVTVVWHSVVWQYLSAGDQAAAAETLEELGARATGSAPFVHLAMEPERATAGRLRLVTSMRVWPGGERRELAESHAHGTWIRWLGTT